MWWTKAHIVLKQAKLPSHSILRPIKYKPHTQVVQGSASRHFHPQCTITRLSAIMYVACDSGVITLLAVHWRNGRLPPLNRQLFPDVSQTYVAFSCVWVCASYCYLRLFDRAYLIGRWPIRVSTRRPRRRRGIALGSGRASWRAVSVTGNCRNLKD